MRHQTGKAQNGSRSAGNQMRHPCPKLHKEERE